MPVNINSELVRRNNADFKLIDSNNVGGGILNFATLAERDAFAVTFPTLLKVGQLAYVSASEPAPYFKLTVLSPVTWVAFTTGGGGGGVTSVSVATANGFAGTVATPTTTPAITVETTVTGVLFGDGTAISAAIPGTDFQAPGSYITALTGDVTAAGPGSAAATIAASAVTGPKIAALAVTDAKVATANKDGAAGTPSMRTLGTGALQAAAGNDARLTPAFGWSRVKQFENGVVAPTATPAGNSYGIYFGVFQSITITGIRFFWNATGGADTVSAKLWGPIAEPPVSIDATPLLRTKMEAVSAAGVYTAIFASPYVVPAGEAGFNFCVTIFQPVGTGVSYSGLGTGLVPGNASEPFLSTVYTMPVLLIVTAGAFDAFPTINASFGYAVGIEPIFTVP